MTNFSDLTVTAPKKANVLFPVLDPNEALAANKNKKYTLSELFSAEPVVSLAAAETLRSTNLLIPNQWYKIANAPGTGDSLYLRAIENNLFAFSGVGLFNVPDFQNTGTYTGVVTVTTIAAGARLGVWTPTIDGTIATGEIVIWNGFHYQCIASGSVNGSNPYTNSTAYTLLPKSAANVGYITEYDEIGWGYANSSLTYRRDKRNNYVENNIYPATHHPYSFQWGNDNVYNNRISFPSAVNMSNFVGSFFNNVVVHGTVTLENENTGQLHSNFINCSQLSFENTSGDFINNIINCHQIFGGIPISENFTNCYKDDKSSTFTMELDLDTYSSGSDIQSINSGLAKLIGTWRLIGAAGSTLESMGTDYLSCTHPIEFIVENGNSQTFQPAAISGASFYSFIGSAGNKTIVGRATGYDSILIRINGAFFEIYQVNNIA